MKNGNYAIQALFHICLKGLDFSGKKETCLLPSCLLKCHLEKFSVKLVESESDVGTSCSQSSNSCSPADDLIKMRNDHVH